MKKLRCKILMHLLLVLSVLVLVPGCGDTSGAPTIPPIETFLIPFDVFTGNATSTSIFVNESHTQTTLLSLPDSEQLSLPLALSSNKSNWNHAALNVGFWSTVVLVGLAVPVAAFQASFRNIPLQQPDGSWIWSYSVLIRGSVHSAELHGQFIPEGVHWNMRISKEDEYQDFLWYYGESNLPATEGFWILKQNPDEPNDLLEIDWSRDISTGTYSIRYTNIVPDGPENGGYIDVQYTDDIPYDYIWDIYNKGQDNHTYIEFSGSTGEGRVKDLNRFGDDDWHCWDSDQMNVACP
ncbi:MAG: hypothetical protein ACOC6O_00095 [Chloroflexota bacterium]